MNRAQVFRQAGGCSSSVTRSIRRGKPRPQPREAPLDGIRSMLRPLSAKRSDPSIARDIPQLRLTGRGGRAVHLTNLPAVYPPLPAMERLFEGPAADDGSHFVLGNEYASPSRRSRDGTDARCGLRRTAILIMPAWPYWV